MAWKAVGLLTRHENSNVPLYMSFAISSNKVNKDLKKNIRTYCSVDNRVRKFPSFLAAQRLISTSSVPEILCKQSKENKHL